MEIGSEFWKESKQYIKEDETLYLSGRTALYAIVKDAVKNYGIRSALLPSYCCHTMIEPFIKNRVDIRFYDVYFSETDRLTADIPAPSDFEMLYIMKYFGDTEMVYEGVGKHLNGWRTTVEDLTHSCFNKEYKTSAEYWFTSYRKWFAVDGIAVAGKRNSKLSEPEKGENIDYCRLRSEAFSLKNRFISNEIIEKKTFLKLFGEAEESLGNGYIEYGASLESIGDLFVFLDDADKMRAIRRKNAAVLQKGLSDIEGIKCFTDFEDESKCPLFVPILVTDGKRNQLRSYLIEREIYLPVHWPFSVQHSGILGRAREIYEDVLSIVCDQRYTEKDMMRIIGTIAEFMRQT